MVQLPRLKRWVLALMLLLGATSAIAESGERYFMVMFAVQGYPHLARNSHSFATFVVVRDGVVVDEETISWLPARGYFGPGYSMPPLRMVPGANYTRQETMAMYPAADLSQWGPFEISERLYEAASERVAYLDRGVTSYKMMNIARDQLRDAPLHNRPGGSINCIMAISDIGGYINTGTAYGPDASWAVLQHLSRWVLSDISAGGDALVGEQLGLNGF